VQTPSDGWDYPENVRTPLIALIRAMTARQPEHRLESMGEVARRLVELRRDEAPKGLTVAVSPSRRAARTALIAGGVLLACSLLVITWQQDIDYLVSIRNSSNKALVPYSEAVEMEKGLAALKLFDRPGSLQEAQSHFERILARAPENAAAVAGMSLVYNMRYGSDGQDEIWLQKADASAQQALKLNDQLALGYVATAAVRESQGRFDEALTICERALRLDPGNYYAWYFKAETLRQARRYREARAVLAAALSRFPRERVFIDELGSVEYEQGDDVAAEQAFRRSIALEPDAVVAYANLNAALLHQNRSDEALRVLQQGLQVRPSAKLYGNLGNALFLRGDYVGAAAAFEDAVSPKHGAPGNYLNWANLGDALRWLPGREQQARQAYDKARQLLVPRLQRSPEDVVLVSRMGLYAARAGSRIEAMQLFDRAVKMAPGSADVQFRAGLGYELLGERRLALAAIGAARRLGYPDKFIEAEPDLVSLRRDPGYQAN
jgi:serine/threonine-protein kinase